jgi:hypothetical protein
MSKIQVQTVLGRDSLPTITVDARAFSRFSSQIEHQLIELEYLLKELGYKECKVPIMKQLIRKGL